MNLPDHLQYTLLRPEATTPDIAALCTEARHQSFYTVGVNGSRVELARHLLEDSPVKVAAAVGFPLGAMDPDAKRFEAEVAVDAGAQEIDAVMNMGWLKEGADRLVLRELRDLIEAAEGVPVKVVLESALLTPQEMLRACKLVAESGAAFITTSTGMGGSPITVAIVSWLHNAMGPSLRLCAAGGIRDAASAQAFLDAGADRIVVARGEYVL